MLTITLPERGYDRLYETVQLREQVAQKKLHVQLNKCMRETGRSQQEHREFASTCTERVIQTWADGDTEIILLTGGYGLNRDGALEANTGWFWLSPRPLESAEHLLKIEIFGDNSLLRIRAAQTGDGVSPSAVRLNGVVVGAPPFIVPVGYIMELRFDPPAMAWEIEVCPDCECFHPRLADCPGPAAK